MRDISTLEKQQVGLRVPKYLLDEVDNFTKMFDVNRSEVIIEAIRTYIKEQKANLFYKEFEESCKELKNNLEYKNNKTTTLEDLIDEFKNIKDEELIRILHKQL